MNDLDHNKINFMAENKKNDKGQESLRKLTIKEF